MACDQNMVSLAEGLDAAVDICRGKAFPNDEQQLVFKWPKLLTVVDVSISIPAKPVDREADLGERG